VKTYPAMNAKIVDLLRLRDDPVSLYAAARIEELEKKIAGLFADLQERDQALHVESEALGYADDRSERMEQALERAAKYIYNCVAEECPPGPVCEGPCDVREFVECWKKYFLGGAE
jgi:hypothetical protein